MACHIGFDIVLPQNNNNNNNKMEWWVEQLYTIWGFNNKLVQQIHWIGRECLKTTKLYTLIERPQLLSTSKHKSIQVCEQSIGTRRDVYTKQQGGLKIGFSIKTLISIKIWFGCQPIAFFRKTYTQDIFVFPQYHLHWGLCDDKGLKTLPGSHLLNIPA